MKLHKNIIVAAVAGITVLAPVISQTSAVLADVAATNQTNTNTNTNTNNPDTSATDKTETPVAEPISQPIQDTHVLISEISCPVAEPISQPIQDNDPEPKTNIHKTKKTWSKRHQKANNYFNKNVKKGQKLTNKTKKLALYKKTLKHFKNYKTKYAKTFKKYLNAEIKWLNRQIKKDVPTTKPSGDLKPQPVQKPKKAKAPTNDHGGWFDTIIYKIYLQDYKYYKKYPTLYKKDVKNDIKALKKRGYKFNADLSDKGYKKHNKKLEDHDNLLMDEGKLK
ncbi:hypothetical protein [Lactobacillus melliventris]|uniref:Uncharacterized protein n=1 Tax=Lactobacillus melliventris TaxID=1218507 RepID=A0A0F4LJU0_9LACO|nr:hypothetical protein [Lactobacillus melliventris]KJY58509.1 hypothetical protein JF74_01810 [Lactobacillus melliventris]